MDVKINKGEISNFAKLQLNFPEGFTAELLEGKGGTFTFYDQKMKLIWISLPSDPEFTVKLKVATDPIHYQVISISVVKYLLSRMVKE